VERGLDPAEMIYNILLELSLPRDQARSLPVEDERIPFVPNAPGANHNNFHEQGLTKRLPGDQKLFMDICIFIPGNSKSKPS
jgi:hypothetical protein